MHNLLLASEANQKFKSSAVMRQMHGIFQKDPNSKITFIFHGKDISQIYFVQQLE
jgi:hypothetical protein